MNNLNPHALEAANTQSCELMQKLFDKCNPSTMPAIDFTKQIIQAYLSALPAVDEHTIHVIANINSVIGWLEAHVEQDNRQSTKAEGSRHLHYIQLLKDVLPIIRGEK